MCEREIVLACEGELVPFPSVCELETVPVCERETVQVCERELVAFPSVCEREIIQMCEREIVAVPQCVSEISSHPHPCVSE